MRWGGFINKRFWVEISDEKPEKESCPWIALLFIGLGIILFLGIII